LKVTEAVCQQARRLFTPENAEEVIAAFGRTEFPLVANNGERVCWAILQLSEGDMDRFYRKLRQATMDWRGTLVAAGL
jgi:hypothetical protein